MKIRFRPLMAAAGIAATTLFAPIAAELAFAPAASAAPCEFHRHAHHIGNGFSDTRHGDDWGTAPHRRGHGGNSGGNDGDGPRDRGHGHATGAGLGHALRGPGGDGRERRERHRLEGKAECAVAHEAGLGKHERHNVQDWLRRQERHHLHRLEHGRI